MTGPLPNLLVVGAAKAGTTALAQYLSGHPQIYFPRDLKESFFLTGLTPQSFSGPGCFYGERIVTTLEEYAGLFTGAEGAAAVGEACVGYLFFHGATIPRIREVLGDGTKIVICLRHPVDRAYSNYLHHKRDGIEPLPFGQALAESGARIAQGWWWGFDYVKAGLYHDQVKAYLDQFGSARVLILLYDDFVDDPAATLSRICHFLEVEDVPNLDTGERPNVSGVPRNEAIHRLLFQTHKVRNRVPRALGRFVPRAVRRLARRTVQSLRQWNLAKPGIDPEQRAELLEQFREDIIKTQELIGRDLSAWLL